MISYPVIEHLSKKYKILVVNQSFEYNKSDYPCDIITITDFTIIDIIRTFFIKLKADELKLLKEVERNINSRFKVTVELTSIFKNRIIQNSSIKKMQYKKLFNNIKPKALIYCNDGSQQGIVESANCLDIKTIELQHGHISNLHPFYFSKCKNHILDEKIIPDYFFSFGDLWNNSIIKAKKVISVGSPIFSILKERYYKEKKSNGIFIVSSGNQGRSLQLFSKIICSLAEAMPKRLIYLKLRIEEYENWKYYYDNNINDYSNVIVIDNDDISYFEYFNKCNYALGIDSTLLFEALDFGLVPIIIKTGWYKQMKVLYDKDLALFASNAEEIIKMIKNGDVPKNKLDVDNIFMKNSLENIERAIGAIIGE